MSLQSFGTHTLYVSRYKWASLAGDWWKYRNRPPIGWKELHAIERESNLAVAIAPMARITVEVRRSGREARSAVNGTNGRFLDTAAGTVGTGRFLVDSDVELARPVAVVGADVMDRLFPGSSPEAVVGERVLIAGRPFSVIGVLVRRGRMLGMDQDNELHIPYTQWQRLFGTKRPMVVAVAGQPGKLEALEDELTPILRRVRQVAPGQDDTYLALEKAWKPLHEARVKKLEDCGDDIRQLFEAASLPAARAAHLHVRRSVTRAGAPRA